MFLVCVASKQEEAKVCSQTFLKVFEEQHKQKEKTEDKKSEAVLEQVQKIGQVKEEKEGKAELSTTYLDTSSEFLWAEKSKHNLDFFRSPIVSDGKYLYLVIKDVDTDPKEEPQDVAKKEKQLKIVEPSFNVLTANQEAMENKMEVEEESIEEQKEPKIEDYRVFMGEIPLSFDEEGVRDLIGSFGTVENLYLPRNEEDDCIQGFAIFQYEDSAVVDNVISNLNGFHLEDRRLVVTRLSSIPSEAPAAAHAYVADNPLQDDSTPPTPPHFSVNQAQAPSPFNATTEVPGFAFITSSPQASRASGDPFFLPPDVPLSDLTECI